jgi:hypothetical protein
MDMIVTLLPVLVPAALVEPTAMRENRSREKHHQQNDNQEFLFHFYLLVISYPLFP